MGSLNARLGDRSNFNLVLRLEACSGALLGSLRPAIHLGARLGSALGTR